MSDSFDPDAWPSAGNNKGDDAQSRDKTSKRGNDLDDFSDDPFDSFDFDDQLPAAPSAQSRNDDDFDGFNFDFDEQPDATRQQASVATSKQTQRDTDPDDDPYGDDPYIVSDDDDYNSRGGNTYDDDDDDDFESDYDDFDREPRDGSDNKRKLMGIGAAVLLVLAVGFGAASFLGKGDSNKAAAPSQQPAAQTQDNAGDVGSSATPSTEAPAAQTPAPAVQGDQNANSQTLPDDASKALSNALTAWGKFAINGDLSVVQPDFVKDGPQYSRFQTESADIKSKAVGGDALTMKMTNPTSSKVDSDWLVRGTVVVSRPNEKDQSFPWEVRMTRQSDKTPWQVLSVRQF